MIKKTFKKEDWAKALEGLKDHFKVLVPVKEGDFHNFRLLQDGSKPNFEFQNTRLSTKSVIFPQSERMFEYTLDGSKEDAHVVKEAPKDFSPQVIVGIRPCDASAFQLVKINFDNPRIPGSLVGSAHGVHHLCRLRMQRPLLLLLLHLCGKRSLQ